MTDSYDGQRRAVYTALIGNYDCLRPLRFKSSIPLIVFTDIPNLDVQGWVTRQVSDLGQIPHGAPAWTINRYLKMHPHEILPDQDETLYVDANIILSRDPSPLFHKYLADADIAIPAHMDRNEISEELKECLRVGKVSQAEYETMSSRLALYDSIGVSSGPFTENGVILRRNTSQVSSAMELWWAEVANGVTRDQLSLPYALHKTGLKISVIKEGPRTTGEYMTIRPHWPYGKRRSYQYYTTIVSALRHRSPAHMIAAKVVDLLVKLKAQVATLWVRKA